MAAAPAGRCIYMLDPVGHYKYMHLPAGAAATFPAIYAPAPTALSDRVVPIHANLKVTLPAGYSGRFSAPFVLVDVRGEGEIDIAGRVFEVGDPAAYALINDRVLFAHDVTVRRADSDLEFIYLVHPGRWRMAQDNQVLADGVNADALEAELVPLIESQKLPYSLPIEHQPW
ncbi:MAG: hypothetical protein AAFU65_05290 [Pseudomonadota bacterium]